MLLQVPQIEFEAWEVVYVLLSLVSPTLPPIIAGVSYGSRSFWVSERLGFFIGLGVSLAGTGAYIAFIYRDRIFPIEADVWIRNPYAAFGGLAVLLAIQLSLVVGACWLVARLKERSWKRDLPRFRL